MAKRDMPTKPNEPEKLIVLMSNEPEKLIEVTPFVKTVNTKKTVTLFNCKMLNIREEPNKKAKVLATVKTGVRLFVKPVDNEWFKIININGKLHDGYVLKQFTKEM